MRSRFQDTAVLYFFKAASFSGSLLKRSAKCGHEFESPVNPSDMAIVDSTIYLSPTAAEQHGTELHSALGGVPLLMRMEYECLSVDGWCKVLESVNV